MQEDIGVKPKTSDEEKKIKAEKAATMGSGRKAQAKGSRFLELRSIIVQRLKDIHSKLQKVKELENAGYGGDNPTQLIKINAEIREETRQAQDEWKEMDAIYKKEARKKRSKFSEEELETQQDLVQQLYEKIEQVKSIQMAARTGTSEMDAAAGILASSGMRQPTTGIANNSAMGGGGGGGASLTEGQRLQIQELEERDADFDRQLDQIGEGIQDLGEIAALQNEEVKHQAAMLDNLNDKIDGVNDRVTNVNARMKETLDEVGRSSDKLIVDIICIVLALSFAAILYRMISS
eukprot:CAMPEP_0178915554 /NCGR_PEP_ID=MMETSP0786-20121207/12088_1 /TAXON_ID=186022 /ORGANISM="Thalassionema frauenfeldii, Strain CCMP 1798" /LENGTH=291 /DNA_ID=CAMNT_0020588671 /DNA_START=234 /DNA_END=1109 /DNA_ORIENTATION=-